ncbi:hypothetical protein [Bradyrhizobium brasilense]|uniref:Uncharacterized protein n=1 Tax=Bradyrhizobium brasilense TaxID=1419277 RepID=A0ABY8JBC7_9BRAD|nr:hypothetical protein [Bradyrhizobium brasilense]WFU62796.1 hypothetical protein QA636_36050 [Bradyrhizobium brasilense]
MLTRTRWFYFQCPSKPASMMTSIDDKLSEIRWVRNEIWRCRRLLTTELPREESVAVEKRLLEQLSAFERLLTTAFPLVLSYGVKSSESNPIGLSESTEALVENASTASTGSVGSSIGG